MTNAFNRSTRIALTLGLAFGAMTLAAQPALASQPDTDKVNVAVSYADLDLNTDAGRARLETRIQHAAVQACGSAPTNQMELRQVQQYKSCRDRAVAKAIAAIDNRSGASLAAK